MSTQSVATHVYFREIVDVLGEARLALFPLIACPCVGVLVCVHAHAPNMDVCSPALSTFFAQQCYLAAKWKFLRIRWSVCERDWGRGEERRRK